ncbi:hypothetical protein TRFO_07808 [Tritrichomonas foetus]|uniref:Uncharacterized protein n=1 Tax=Tritrichomonas foetus TaxID=1144522 RepID=A0A1J4JQX6_9EUKA|nr:hypothetical protein TRFO_07808 [Tritrichomonas foetus]|eukprot:OHT00816.1 hypothetical protein TRFO_07808 [Tritrichomonas foetus]
MYTEAILLIKYSNIQLNDAPADICKYCTDLWNIMKSTITLISKLDGILCAISGSLEINDQSAKVKNAYTFIYNCFTKFNEIFMDGPLSASFEQSSHTNVCFTECKHIISTAVTGEAFVNAFKKIQICTPGQIAVEKNIYQILGQLNGIVEKQRCDEIHKYFFSH